MNFELAKQVGLSRTQIQNVITLQKQIEQITETLKNTDIDKKEYIVLLEKWRDINYVLQSIWGFKLIKEKHPSWYLPNCSCPKLDNTDYGEHYYHTIGCKSCELLTEIDKTFHIYSNLLLLNKSFKGTFHIK